MDEYSISDMDVTSSDRQDTYVYLDFNGKLPVDVFKKEVFIQLANLHEKDAFVQVNDTVFKGTFDQAVGTNLFFNTVENSPQQTNAFDKRGLKQLDYILRNTLVINLKQVKVPPKKVKLPNEKKKIEFNLNWDYSLLLEKFEDGTLKGEDIIIKELKESTYDKQDVHEDVCEEFQKELKHKKGREELLEEVQGKLQEEVQGEVHGEVHAEVHEDFGGELVLLDQEPEMEHKTLMDKRVAYDSVPVNMLEESYKKLKIMALRPMRMELSPELIEKCDSKYRAAYEYDSLRHQVITPSDFFRREPVAEVNPNFFSSFVDIDRCVLYGILDKSSEYPREITEEEKQHVLTLDNFDNLSLVARFNVLKNQVDNLEKDIGNKNENEVNMRDEFDRTPLQTLEIYRKLRDVVKKRINEISYSESCFVNSEKSVLAGIN